jgi:hypothetical protein
LPDVREHGSGQHDHCQKNCDSGEGVGDHAQSGQELSQIVLTAA